MTDLIAQAEALPTDTESALEMMRFGCPFERPFGDFDVKYFERRMLKAADIFEAALRAQAAEQPAEAVALEVHLGDMHESNGRVTWVVSLCRAGDSVFDGYQIYADTIKGRAEYEAAALKHLLGQGPKPDLLAFDTDPPTAVPDPRIAQLEGLLRALDSLTNPDENFNSAINPGPERDELLAAYTACKRVSR